MGYLDDQAEREVSQRMSAAIREKLAAGRAAQLDRFGLGTGAETQDTPVSGRGFDQGGRGGHVAERAPDMNAWLRGWGGTDDGVPAGATVEA